MCVTNTLTIRRIAKKTASISTDLVSLRRTMLPARNTVTAHRLASETYLNAVNTAPKAARPKASDRGLMASATPRPAATPFPPLNFR